MDVLDTVTNGYAVTGDITIPDSSLTVGSYYNATIAEPTSQVLRVTGGEDTTVVIGETEISVAKLEKYMIAMDMLLEKHPDILAEVDTQIAFNKLSK